LASHTAPRNSQYLYPSRFHDQPHISIRQYARIVHRWVEAAGPDGSAYGTHSMRRTKVAQIYKKTGNLRAVRLLLGHTKRAAGRSAKKLCGISSESSSTTTLRPILFYTRAADCREPYLNGLTTMVNSIYNGSHFEDLWLAE
jgi:hypothetical protein